MTIWDLRRDSMAFIADAPAEYTAFTPSPLLVFASARVDVCHDTVAVLYGARNDLMLQNRSGQPIARIDIPIKNRRGVSAAQQGAR